MHLSLIACWNTICKCIIFNIRIASHYGYGPIYKFTILNDLWIRFFVHIIFKDQDIIFHTTNYIKYEANMNCHSKPDRDFLFEIMFKKIVMSLADSQFCFPRKEESLPPFVRNCRWQMPKRVASSERWKSRRKQSEKWRRKFKNLRRQVWRPASRLMFSKLSTWPQTMMQRFKETCVKKFSIEKFRESRNNWWKALKAWELNRRFHMIILFYLHFKSLNRCLAFESGLSFLWVTVEQILPIDLLCIGLRAQIFSKSRNYSV